MIRNGKLLSILIMVIAGILLFLWPIACVYGKLFYLTFMPTDSVELTPGRNVLFLTLMKGKYVLKIAGEKGKKNPNGFSVKGQIKTSSSTNVVNIGKQLISSGEPCSYSFECNRNIERVDILLDLPTDSAEEIYAVVFPIK